MSKKPNRITEELLETAKGMHRVGILDEKAYEKITKRHLGKDKQPALAANGVTKASRLGAARGPSAWFD